MRPIIFLLVTLAISVSSGVNGQVRPDFISVYDEEEILPVPKECPKVDDPTVVIHIAHETDCDKFYRCSFGKKVLMQCPKDLHFNPRKQVCDFPADAGCAPTGGSEPTTPTTTTTDWPSSTFPPTPESTTPKPTTTTTTEATSASTGETTAEPTTPSHNILINIFVKNSTIIFNSKLL